MGTIFKINVGVSRKPGKSLYAHSLKKDELLTIEEWKAVYGSRNNQTRSNSSLEGPPTAVAAKTITVGLKQLANDLAEKLGVSGKAMCEVLNGFVSLLTMIVAKGCKVRIPRLGIFVVRKRAARMGRNPATGEVLKIKARKRIAFRASKNFKEMVRRDRRRR